MDLTKRQVRILRTVADRPMDVFDLSDATGIHPQRAYDDCAALRARRLIEWMYPEDEVAISVSGRAMLEPHHG